MTAGVIRRRRGVPAPWGPIRVAASEQAVVALEVLSTDEAFALGCRNRLGECPRRPRLADRAVRRRLAEATEVVRGLLAGEPVERAARSRSTWPA